MTLVGTQCKASRKSMNDMPIREDEELPKEVYDALVDRYEAWELVELLDLDIRDVIDAFELDIIDNLEDIREELGMKGMEDDD